MNPKLKATLTISASAFAGAFLGYVQAQLSAPGTPLSWSAIALGALFTAVVAVVHLFQAPPGTRVVDTEAITAALKAILASPYLEAALQGLLARAASKLAEAAPAPVPDVEDTQPSARVEINKP